MNYTKEEIIQYIEIVKSVDKSPSPKSKAFTCKKCYSSNCFIDKGYYYCSNSFFFLVLVMFLVITINPRMKDFTFDKSLSIKENITI